MYRFGLFAQENKGGGGVLGGALQGAIIGGIVGACIGVGAIIVRLFKGPTPPKQDDKQKDQADPPAV